MLQITLPDGSLREYPGPVTVADVALSIGAGLAKAALAGIHSMWFNMFDLAQDYAARGMSAYVEKVQEPEFAARDRGYSFVSHQQEVGTGYFDDVTTVIQGGQSSVTALTGSTEEEQFH